MRVCDRCKRENFKNTLVNRMDGTEIDLCMKCNEMFLKFLTETEQPLMDSVKPERQRRTT